MARRATLIKQARQASEHVLVLDAGNCLVGDHEPALRTHGQTSVEVMNRLGYDAVALGAKDLELGPEILKQRIAEATYPMLSANAIDSKTGSRIADPFAMVELGGHHVGIVGISGPPASDQVRIDDPLQAAEATVAQLAGQADIIVVLSNADETTNQAIAAQIAGVDLVIGAAGSVTSQPVSAGGAILLQADQASPGHAGRYVGVARLEFDSHGDLFDAQWRRVALSPDIADDPDFVAWVTEHR